MVRELKCKGLAEHHALEVVVMSASALRYVARNEGNDALRTAILALAHRHTRYGWRMIHLKLRQAGWQVNHKRVRRRYRMEKLMVRKRKRKKVAVAERQPLIRPQQANEHADPTLRHPAATASKDRNHQQDRQSDQHGRQQQVEHMRRAHSV